MKPRAYLWLLGAFQILLIIIYLDAQRRCINLAFHIHELSRQKELLTSQKKELTQKLARCEHRPTVKKRAEQEFGMKPVRLEQITRMQTIEEALATKDVADQGAAS